VRFSDTTPALPALPAGPVEQNGFASFAIGDNFEVVTADTDGNPEENAEDEHRISLEKRKKKRKKKPDTRKLACSLVPGSWLWVTSS
jgi:hypothetical protein